MQNIYVTKIDTRHLCDLKLQPVVVWNITEKSWKFGEFAYPDNLQTIKGVQDIENEVRMVRIMRENFMYHGGILDRIYLSELISEPITSAGRCRVYNAKLRVERRHWDTYQMSLCKSFAV